MCLTLYCFPCFPTYLSLLKLSCSANPAEARKGVFILCFIAVVVSWVASFSPWGRRNYANCANCHTWDFNICLYTRKAILGDIRNHWSDWNYSSGTSPESHIKFISIDLFVQLKYLFAMEIFKFNNLLSVLSILLQYIFLSLKKYFSLCWLYGRFYRFEGLKIFFVFGIF